MTRSALEILLQNILPRPKRRETYHPSPVTRLGSQLDDLVVPARAAEVTRQYLVGVDIECRPRAALRELGELSLRARGAEVAPTIEHDHRVAAAFPDPDPSLERPRPHFQLRQRGGEPQAVGEGAFLADAGTTAALQLVREAGPLAFLQPERDGAQLVRRGHLAQRLQRRGARAEQPV